MMIRRSILTLSLSTSNKLLENDAKPRLRIFHNLARSGGTLVCRCIASMQGICLLSEIHPFGRTNRHFNVINQYQLWYRDLGIESWKSVPFEKSVDHVFDDCASRNQHLILRDWAHIDFIGPPSVKPPSSKLLLNQRLEKKYDLLRYALVRHPAETWRSSSKMRIFQENNIGVEQFLSGYRSYLEEIGNVPIMRYEDFTKSPSDSMELICRYLDVPFDSNFLQNWSSYKNITGDMFNSSRGSGQKEILHFELKEIDPGFKELFASSEDYQFIVSRLDYPY